MDKTVGNLKEILGKIRAGRAHPGLLDSIKIDYYGTSTPLNQMAKVSVLDSSTLSVTPFDRSAMASIEKSIRNSDLGVNPAASGETIRIPIPPLTEERRRDLTKVIKSEGENSKVAIRNIRRDAMDELKRKLKDGDISEDIERREQANIQKLTDQHVSDIDDIIKNKEKELLTV
jgi:ribosome recycling factor